MEEPKILNRIIAKDNIILIEYNLYKVDLIKELKIYLKKLKKALLL